MSQFPAADPTSGSSNPFCHVANRVIRRRKSQELWLWILLGGWRRREYCCAVAVPALVGSAGVLAPRFWAQSSRQPAQCRPHKRQQELGKRSKPPILTFMATGQATQKKAAGKGNVMVFSCYGARKASGPTCMRNKQASRAQMFKKRQAHSS